jgi:Tfp pilus assembly protein PilF
VSLAPDGYLWRANLGAVREKLGDAEAAQAEYTRALDLRPAVASSSFWTQTDLRRSTLAAWQAAHPAQPAQSLTELEAALVDSPDSVDAYLDLARAELAADRFNDADRTLKLAELTTILNGTHRLELYALEAQTAAALGDSDRAADLQTQADNGYQVQGLYGPGTYGQGIYGPLVYRRPALALELVPQMTLFSK